MHDRIIAEGTRERIPIKRFPTDLRVEFYRHALAGKPYRLTGPGSRERAHDAIALLACSTWLRSEAELYLYEKAGLIVDLSDRDVCKERDALTGESITFDTYSDGKLGDLWTYVWNGDWMTRFNSIIFTTAQRATYLNTDAGEPTDKHWENTAFNLKAIFGLLAMMLRAKPIKITFRIGLGNMAGLVPNLTKQQELGLGAPRCLTGLEKTLCTHREHYNLMTWQEYDEFTWRSPPADLTRPSQAWHFAFHKPNRVEMAYKLAVLTWLGNLGRALGQMVFLKKNVEDDEGLEWEIKQDPWCEEGCSCCEGRRPDSKCGGADVKDLYLLANQIDDEGDGLWLCSKPATGGRR